MTPARTREVSHALVLRSGRSGGRGSIRGSTVRSTVLAGFDSDVSTPDFAAEATIELPSATGIELVFTPQ
jgi:hypothetical protein